MVSIARLPTPPSRKKSAGDRITVEVRRDYERFLEAVRARRQELGMSQRELGRRVGNLSGSQVANIERGHSVPSVARLFMIAKALRASPAALVALRRRARP